MCRLQCHEYYRCLLFFTHNSQLAFSSSFSLFHFHYNKMNNICKLHFPEFTPFSHKQILVPYFVQYIFFKFYFCIQILFQFNFWWNISSNCKSFFSKKKVACWTANCHFLRLFRNSWKAIDGTHDWLIRNAWKSFGGLFSSRARGWKRQKSTDKDLHVRINLIKSWQCLANNRVIRCDK